MNTLTNVIHFDESIYPEPYKFKPGRDIPNGSFFPFGSGPRNCIAQRFALLEIKLVLTKIFSKFRIEKCEKTPVS